MRLPALTLAPLGVVATLAFGTAAQAGQVQIDLTYTNLNFDFYVDAPWLDADDAFHYDAAATSTELQDLFGNGLAFGGATWDGADRAWRLDQGNNPFDSLHFSMIFEVDDFDLTNVIGNTGAPQFLNTYASNVNFVARDGGAAVDSGAIYNSFQTISGDAINVDDGHVSDAAGFLGTDANSSLALFFARGSGNTDWFSDVTGDNALEYAVSGSDVGGYLSYDENIYSTLGDQLGSFRINGTASLSTLSYPSTGGSGSGTTPVPLPMPLAMLGTALGGLTLLRRARR